MADELSELIDDFYWDLEWWETSLTAIDARNDELLRDDLSEGSRHSWGNKGDLYASRVGKWKAALIDACAKILAIAPPARVENLRHFAAGLLNPQNELDDALIDLASAECADLLLNIKITNESPSEAHLSESENSILAQSLPAEIVLSETQNFILQEMVEQKAFDQTGRLRAAWIASRVEPNNLNAPDNFKKRLANLVKRGLLVAQKGRGGGYWLSDSGRKIGERMQKGGT